MIYLDETFWWDILTPVQPWPGRPLKSGSSTASCIWAGRRHQNELVANVIYSIHGLGPDLLEKSLFATKCYFLHCEYICSFLNIRPTWTKLMAPTSRLGLEGETLNSKCLIVNHGFLWKSWWYRIVACWANLAIRVETGPFTVRLMMVLLLVLGKCSSLNQINVNRKLKAKKNGSY